MPEIIEIRLTDGGSASPRKDLNGPPQPPKGAGDPAPAPVGAKGQTPIANPTLFPTGGPTPTVGPNAPPQPPVAALAPPTPPGLPAPPQAVPLTPTAPGTPPAPGGFDPVAIATEQMKREMEARRQREAIDRSRRLIDHEYRERKERQELLDRSAMARVRERMRAEQEEKAKKDEEDKIRRQIDPQYRRQKIGESAGSAVRNTLGTASQLAGASGGEAASMLGGMLGKVPIFGQALSAATIAIKGFSDAASGTADRLAKYSPDITAAKAQADMRGILKDMERAQKLGPDLARFVDAKARAGEAWEDVKLAFITRVLPTLTRIMEGVAPLAEILGKVVEALETSDKKSGSFWEKLVGSLDKINVHSGWNMASRASKDLERMREEMEKMNADKSQETDDFLGQAAAMGALPGFVPGRAGAAPLGFGAFGGM